MGTHGRPRLVPVLWALIVVMIVPHATSATNYTWGGTNGNWSNANGWVPVGVPAASDTVVVGAGVVNVDGNVIVTSIAVTTGTLNVLTNKLLNVSDTLQLTQGFITVRSPAMRARAHDVRAARGRVPFHLLLTPRETER